MAEIVELGTISARGQVAIPVSIRKEMGLEEGSRVLFFLEQDTLLLKKVSSQSWEEVTRPLRQAKKKIREDQVDDMIHSMRKRGALR